MIASNRPDKWASRAMRVCEKEQSWRYESAREEFKLLSTLSSFNELNSINRNIVKNNAKMEGVLDNLIDECNKEKKSQDIDEYSNFIEYLTRKSSRGELLDEQKKYLEKVQLAIVSPYLDPMIGVSLEDIVQKNNDHFKNFVNEFSSKIKDNDEYYFDQYPSLKSILPRMQKDQKGTSEIKRIFHTNTNLENAILLEHYFYRKNKKGNRILPQNTEKEREDIIRLKTIFAEYLALKKYNLKV